MTAPADHQAVTPTEQRPLAGHVAVITGAARGIGAAIARELGARGANLVIDYATSSAVAEALAQTVIEANPGVEAIAVQADVADEAQARGLIAGAIARFGRIDILVNNAGITRDRTLRKMTSAQWREVIDTDLNGVFYCTQPAVEQMIAQGSGRIVNISSVIAESGNIGQTNYAAAKGGMISFTRSLALELARYGITANCVAPGFIETDMVAAVPDEIRAQIVSRIPLQRFGTPEEIARVVRFLCIEGGYITGQTISINGGLYM
ncbi:MAG: 3-oxoacyl-ACP reductase [Chloroflexi bacterium]|nr:3-oxoacyl-ACP reductase [Chloroflexota bacterium]